MLNFLNLKSLVSHLFFGQHLASAYCGLKCHLHYKYAVSTNNIIYFHTYNVLTYLADAGSPAAVVAMASASASTGNGVVPVANVSGLLGRSARLPCDTTPPSPDNPLLLVIWFKEPSPDPIYRYPPLGFNMICAFFPLLLVQTCPNLSSSSRNRSILINSGFHLQFGFMICAFFFQCSGTKKAFFSIRHCIGQESF